MMRLKQYRSNITFLYYRLKTVLRGTFIHQVCGDIVRNLHRLNQSKFANPVNTHYIIYVKLCGYITKNTILEYLLARSVYRNSIAIYCSEQELLFVTRRFFRRQMVLRSSFVIRTRITLAPFTSLKGRTSTRVKNSRDIVNNYIYLFINFTV